MSGADPNEHAAYCAICDRPTPTGPLCSACERMDRDQEDEQMDPHELAEWCAIEIEHGNLTDAIDALMREGDVRVSSVVTALHLTRILVERQVRPVHNVTDQLIRLIDRWETDL